MILVLLSGFIVAFAQVFTGKYLRNRLTVLFTILPATLFLYFLLKIPEVSSGEALLYQYPWVPALGIGLNFQLDGLSLLFSLLITGIGTLVFLYAAAYMKGAAGNDRFFGFLSMFMASMLGVVLSDDIISLFLFWELTSISSFYLIGYKNEDAASRKSAYTALAITGGGGLLLFSGLILLANITGTSSIREMAAVSGTIKQHALYGLALLLVLGGAFTKSAQFPFHFWLPAAMKAPTPVSAYLHSATMVKAGVYLAARFTPVLGDHPWWNNTLIIVGGFTMIYTAIHAVFRIDLKAILAYSTVAALGMLFFLIGIGSQEAFVAAGVFILVHALYKAGLFLTAGIIDHEAGTREVTAVHGLRLVMPVVALAGLLAALSSAGLPLTFGFIGKDLIYEATLAYEPWGKILIIVAVVTNICLLFAGFLAGIKPFTGKLPPKLSHVHTPSWMMWFPPLLLGLAGLVFGLLPQMADASLVQQVVVSLSGKASDIYLKIWHGFNFVLLLSAVTLASGLVFYLLFKPSQENLRRVLRLQNFSPERLFDQSVTAVRKFSVYYTNHLQTGYLRFYIFTIAAFVILLLTYKLITDVQFFFDLSKLLEFTVYEIAVFLMMVISIFVTISSSSRLKAVAALGVTGLCICLVFVFYSAPDLAMTQFTIDTLTVVLFVLVLFKLPPFIKYSSTKARIRDGLLAVAFGVLITIIALEVLFEPVDKEISTWYAANAYQLAKGKNIVNVILVDFRGADTLIEITVLTIAAIGVFSLLKLKVNPKEKE